MSRLGLHYLSGVHPDESRFLSECFDDLFPILRSITGPGIEESLAYFGRFMPLEITKVPSGEQVFDWTVPDEWHCGGGQLLGPDGEIVCDTAISNLHLLNYSEGIDTTLTLDELQPHLHSIPSLPTAIPYVTSYYKRTWGFCLSDEQRSALGPGTYTAKIDAEFVTSGGVPFATCTLEGESEREILLTSYLCHPSLANNELSGPLVLLALYQRLAKWPRRRFTYRFLLNPETIGALCFLSRYAEHLQANLEAGLVLTCVGGPASTLRYKASRMGASRFDRILHRIAQGSEPNPLGARFEPFTPLGGSDERQYCSPGFNLPIGQIARTAYGEYDGYHNSLDTKEWMGIERLSETAEAIEDLLSVAEISGNPVNLSPFGEPQLGKRNLYPSMSAVHAGPQSADGVDGRTQLDRILTMLSMADGNTAMEAIADQCGCGIGDLRSTLERLEEEDLIEMDGAPLNA